MNYTTGEHNNSPDKDLIEWADIVETLPMPEVDWLNYPSMSNEIFYSIKDYLNQAKLQKIAPAEALGVVAQMVRAQSIFLEIRMLGNGLIYGITRNAVTGEETDSTDQLFVNENYQIVRSAGGSFNINLGNDWFFKRIHSTPNTGEITSVIEKKIIINSALPGGNVAPIKYRSEYFIDPKTRKLSGVFSMHPESIEGESNSFSINHDKTKKLNKGYTFAIAEDNWRRFVQLDFTQDGRLQEVMFNLNFITNLLVEDENEETGYRFKNITDEVKEKSIFTNCDVEGEGRLMGEMIHDPVVERIVGTLFGVTYKSDLRIDAKRTLEVFISNINNPSPKKLREIIVFANN